MTAPLTPGAYLALRRRSAGVEIEQLAAAIATEPRLPERDRAEFIRALEADLVSPTITELAALNRHFRSDITVLAALVDPVPGIPVPRVCRTCGCSDRDPCLAKGGWGCSWAGPDLCNVCLGAAPFDAPEREAAA